MQEYGDDILPHLIETGIFPCLPGLPTNRAVSQVDFENDGFDGNQP